MISTAIEEKKHKYSVFSHPSKLQQTSSPDVFLLVMHLSFQAQPVENKRGAGIASCTAFFLFTASYLNLQVNTQKYSQRATRISFAAFDKRLRSALSVG